MSGRVSIAMYSTFTGRSFKATRLRYLVPALRERGALVCAYGLKCLREETPPDIRASALPVAASFGMKQIARTGLVAGHTAYRTGERVTGWLFAHRVARDSSTTVLCKQRPYSIVAAASGAGKRTVVGYAEMHPELERDRLLRDYEQFGIRPATIRCDPGAIREALRSVDRADRIVVLSEACLESFLEAGVPAEKMRVMQPYVCVDSVAQTKEERRAFISTAYHSVIKGTHRLLLAWRQAGITDIPLVIVGPLGRDIRHFIRRYGPFPNVEFAGFQEPSSFYAQFGSAVGVLPSLAEGNPRAVQEFLACGFPVLVSPVATCDLVRDGCEGFVVPYDDTDALTDRLLYIRENWDRVQDMSPAALAASRRRTLTEWLDDMMALLTGEEEQ